MYFRLKSQPYGIYSKGLLEDKDLENNFIKPHWFGTLVNPVNFPIQKIVYQIPRCQRPQEPFEIFHYGLHTPSEVVLRRAASCRDQRLGRSLEWRPLLAHGWCVQLLAGTCEPLNAYQIYVLFSSDRILLQEIWWLYNVIYKVWFQSIWGNSGVVVDTKQNHLILKARRFRIWSQKLDSLFCWVFVCSFWAKYLTHIFCLSSFACYCFCLYITISLCFYVLHIFP